MSMLWQLQVPNVYNTRIHKTIKTLHKLIISQPFIDNLILKNNTPITCLNIKSGCFLCIHSITHTYLPPIQVQVMK